MLGTLFRVRLTNQCHLSGFCRVWLALGGGGGGGLVVVDTF